MADAGLRDRAGDRDAGRHRRQDRLASRPRRRRSNVFAAPDGSRTTLASSPYAAGLALLARRERSTAQLRDRLRRKGFEPEPVEHAIRRLQRDGALDDRRTANLYTRRAVLVSHRGPRRARQELEALGIAPAVAQAAVDEVYAEVELETIVERALDRRLTGQVRDRAHFGRLYRYLVRQGFDDSLAIDALRQRAAAGTGPDD